MNSLSDEIKVIVFDVDGTIMDSIGRIVECMQAAACACGVAEPSVQEVRNIIGITLHHAVEVLFPEQSPEKIDQITDEYCRLYNLWEIERPTSLFPGAMKTLQTLKQRGYRLAIATGKSQRGLARLYGDQELCSLFSASVTGDQVKSKPHPMMLQKLMNQLEIKPSEAVMVGDSVLDLQMAGNCDVRSIGITWGVHSREQLQQETPVAVIDDLSQLLEIF
jgi:phosphoglycolate phosphatase